MLALVRSRLLALAIGGPLYGVLLPPALLAQSVWTERDGDNSITLEVLKPGLVEDDSATFATSVLFFSGRIQVSHELTLAIELPFAHYGADSKLGTDMYESSFGNPYLGVELRAGGQSDVLQVGVRFPVAPERHEKDGWAAFMGAHTDFPGRADAFVPDYVPLTVTIDHLREDETGFVRLRGGMCMSFTRTRKYQSETFLLYGGQVGMRAEPFRLAVGLTGRTFVAGIPLPLLGLSYHHLHLGASTSLGCVRPWVSFGLPVGLADWGVVDSVVGVGVSVRI